MFSSSILYGLVSNRTYPQPTQNFDEKTEKDYTSYGRRFSDASPILLEQRRRSSLCPSGRRRSLNTEFPEGIAIPNSVIRRKSLQEEELQQEQMDREYRLSLRRTSEQNEIENLRNELKQMPMKDLEQRILQRIAKEKSTQSAEPSVEDMGHRIMTPKVLLMEGSGKHKRKKPIDKQKEMNRILRRTSGITPYKERRMSTFDDLRDSINRSERKINLLTEPERIIEQHIILSDSDKLPPAELTHSWIRRMSDSLSESSKRISELSERMNANRTNTPASTTVPKLENIDFKKKKEKAVKRKSSSKMSKLGSPHLHPTIPEADEEAARRTESRQTEFSTSSLRSKHESVKSMGSVTKRPSTDTRVTKRKSSNSTNPMNKDSITSRERAVKGSTSSLKDFGSTTSRRSNTKPLKKEVSKERSLKGSTNSLNDIRSSSSRKSGGLQRLSSSSERSKTKKKSSSELSGKRVGSVSSRSSSRTRPSSDDKSISTASTTSDDQKPRESLASLIDLYYSNPQRRATLESLEEYTNVIMGHHEKREDKKTGTSKENIPDLNSEHSFIFNCDVDQASVESVKVQLNESDNIAEIPTEMDTTHAKPKMLSKTSLLSAPEDSVDNELPVSKIDRKSSLVRNKIDITQKESLQRGTPKRRSTSSKQSPGTPRRRSKSRKRTSIASTSSKKASLKSSSSSLKFTKIGGEKLLVEVEKKTEQQSGLKTKNANRNKPKTETESKTFTTNSNRKSNSSTKSLTKTHTSFSNTIKGRRKLSSAI